MLLYACYLFLNIFFLLFVLLPDVHHCTLWISDNGFKDEDALIFKQLIEVRYLLSLIKINYLTKNQKSVQNYFKTILTARASFGIRLIWPITSSGRGATGSCAMPPSFSKPYLLQKHYSYRQETRNLRYLNLSYNQFRETGGRMLGDAIGYNDSLREIDLSWNHIRRDGAIGIAEGLMV